MASKTPIRTAGCLIIGDEVLNGKIVDTNSQYYAKYCFDLGIELKKIEVVGDDEADIIRSVRYMAEQYDFVVTSGGIGPTHDDLTYEAIARAFNMPVKLDPTTVERMQRLRSRTIANMTEEIKQAQYRMAILPYGSDAEYIFPIDTLWVPVVRVVGKVHILPGVPQLFQKLLESLKEDIASRTDSGRHFVRYFVACDLAESAMAPYLTKLQSQVDGDVGGKLAFPVKIGSYPHMGLKVNTVSIIGRRADDGYLREVVADVVAQLGGREISAEEEKVNSADRAEVKLGK